MINQRKYLPMGLAKTVIVYKHYRYVTVGRCWCISQLKTDLTNWIEMNRILAYLHKEDCNYISVDWENLAILPFYPRSAISSVIVGVFTGVFINFLVEQGADLNQFHVIGFSMGAHIAGNAGSTVKGTLPRITGGIFPPIVVINKITSNEWSWLPGLDPAYPFFSLFGTDQRLDITDAEFVDIIHCNSGTVGRILDIEQLITDFQVTVSYPEAIGHADFYPNGGSSQPGCGIIHSGGFIDFMRKW